jgi:hypothetical protein
VVVFKYAAKNEATKNKVTEGNANIKEVPTQREWRDYPLTVRFKNGTEVD